ncbi:hypothetical protein H5410_049989 [Solanum commersonii]|uniref:Uncharacterized protein n=1 Tax=Solanum commersonii TaxID=4109 RepID=A0A9J5WUC4_SOLCO|nr:hypothetical protein H5410_049989 [Solanum commersonii]
MAREIANVVLCAVQNSANRAHKIKLQPYENCNHYFGFEINPLTNDYKSIYKSQGQPNDYSLFSKSSGNDVEEIRELKLFLDKEFKINDLSLSYFYTW